MLVLMCIQQYIKPLMQKAVVYVNVDWSTQGNYSMIGGGLPIVYDAIYDASKKVCLNSTSFTAINAFKAFNVRINY